MYCFVQKPNVDKYSKRIDMNIIDDKLIVSPKFGIAETLASYLTNTKTWKLLLHLVWLACVCSVLSMTYILAFHTSSLISVYQEAHNIQNFSSHLVQNTKQDITINNLLEGLMKNTKASRAYVFRYHNGLAAINGVPFFFQSNTHEVISPGTARVVQFEQHIPASINLVVSNQFMMNKCAVVPRADEDKDSQNYWFFQNRQAKSLVRCPIFMTNGDLFGFVGIDYTDRADVKDLAAAAGAVKDMADSLAKIFAR